MRCYLCFLTAQFRGLSAECCMPFQNSTWLFPLSYQGDFSAGGQQDQSLSGAIQAAQTLECPEQVPLQSRHWGQQREAIHTGMNQTLRYQ